MKMTRIQIYTALIVGLVISFPAISSAAEVIKTPAEAARYTRYSQDQAITRFLSRLDHGSRELAVRIVGRTLPAADYPARDLYLCVLTETGIDRPENLDRSKPTFYLVAAKHGNEQSAKEAALRLVRDLAAGDLKPLLKHLNVLVMPTANPYGNHFDQRRNEQDLDLNRDQVKLESPEAEAIIRVFVSWMPEVTMDVHEKGDDYYQVNIGCVSNVNIARVLQDFPRERLFPEIEESLTRKGYTFHEYLITQRMGIDSSAGVTYAPRDMGRRETMKRYSTTDLNDGRNSPGIYQTLSFIQEGASRHDLATLEERTDYQYFGIRFTMEGVARHADEVLSMVRGLRDGLREEAKTYSPANVVHLRMRYARDPEQPTLTIKRFERSASPIRGILKTDKKAGETVTLADLESHAGPATRRIVDEVIENWFPRVESTLSVSRPLGYLVPAKHEEVIETLHRHGIRLQVFTADARLPVEVYQVSDVQVSDYDYLPPKTITVEKKVIEVTAAAGDVYVSCLQPCANLIPCLLEPQSQYGFIRYWKFGLVPEKGNLFPFSRVVAPHDLPLASFKNWVR